MFRFSHTADIHFSEKVTLGRELVIDPATGRNVRLGDVRRCCDHFLAELKKHPPVHAHLIAGDLADTCRPTPNEEREMIGWVTEMARSAVVVAIRGNHDYSGAPGEADALTCLQGRENIVIVDRPGYVDLGMYKGRVASTFVRIEEALTEFSFGDNVEPLARVFALPWPSRSALIAENEGASAEELNRAVTAKLQLIVGAMRATVCPGVPSVLMFHGTIAGAEINHQPASLQSDIGLTTGDIDWADYVALGHIHKRQRIDVSSSGSEVWYPGSLDRSDVTEEHEAKGGHLVELGSVAGILPKVTFIETPARRYKTHTPAEVLERGIDDDGETVHRIKGQVTEDERQQIRARLENCKVRHLYFDLEVVRNERERELVAENLSDEEILRRRLEKRGLPADEIAEVMAVHGRISAQVGA